MSDQTSKKPPKLSKKAYEKELLRLQAELVDMQQWVVETGARLSSLWKAATPLVKALQLSASRST